MEIGLLRKEMRVYDKLHIKYLPNKVYSWIPIIHQLYILFELYTIS